MIEAAEVHQLVDKHVIADGGGHQDETPVQGDLAVTAA
jgi:hypothetical protein